MTRLAIMQPYYFPYIGYFQLIAAVDHFIVYDNIKYTKKGWINRNRMLRNGEGALFSLPLKNGSDYLNICERELAPDFDPRKQLNQLKGAYGNAPFIESTLPLLELVLHYEDTNLFRFLRHSIRKTCEHLGITTEISVSSDIKIDHDLKSQNKVIALCDAVGASTYVNAAGGKDLYSKEAFLAEGISLKFIHSRMFIYTQLGSDFVPWLSIIDVMMFNSIEVIQAQLSQIDLR